MANVCVLRLESKSAPAFALCPGAPALMEMVAAAAADIYSEHGAGAFEMPRSAAAFHEGGRCVAYAAAGIPVKWVRMRHVRHSNGTLLWGGLTMTNRPGWSIGSDTDPEDDRREMRCLIAGVMAERLFATADFRHGSSLDEQVLAQAIAHRIGAKTKRDPKQLYFENCNAVRALLERNADVVQTIAQRLMLTREIKGKPLAALLGRVKP